MSELKAGDRIRLIEMPDDPNPIPPGTEGIVRHMGHAWSDGKRQVYVTWDNGRTLILLDGHDRYEIVDSGK